MSEYVYVDEHRDDLPIFIHSELDDLSLTLEAFRVYAHLARRAGKTNMAWPSYTSIGETCFRPNYPKAQPETLRRKAIAAVNELIKAGVIEKIIHKYEHGGNATNGYRLLPRRQWGGALTPPSALTPGGGALTPPSALAPPSVNAPKGTPYEGTPYEGNPRGEASAQPTQGTPPTASPAPPPDPYADTPREQPPPAKPSRAKQAKAPALAEHPAVAIYRELCERYPSKLQMKLIAEADPPLDNWVRAIRTWGGRGHNITNIEGILDWAINPKLMQRKSGKHKSNSISQPDQGQAAADEAEIQAAIEWAKIHYPDKFIHDNQAAARDPSGGG